MSNAAPGWHPQPDGRDRYWDGQQWTEQYRPTQGTTPPPPAAAGATLNHKQLKAAAKASRPWYKKKRFIIPLAILLIAALSSMLGGKSDSKDTAKSSSTPAETSTQSSGQSSDKAEQAPAMAAIGQPVKEGDIEFTITSWKCGAKRVGSADFGQSAQGQFCIADVVYKNLGKESKMFDSSALTAYQGETQFKADSGAGMYVNKDAQTFLDQVNPGNSAKGKIVFDVPANAKIERVNIVDGFTGEGTPIKVG